MFDEISFSVNFSARKELKDGNFFFLNNNFYEAENSWNNSIKIATNFSSYDPGKRNFKFLCFSLIFF